MYCRHGWRWLFGTTHAYQKEFSSVQHASGVRLKCHLTMSVSVSVSVCKSQAIHQTVSTTVTGFMDETPQQSRITHSALPDFGDA